MMPGMPPMMPQPPQLPPELAKMDPSDLADLMQEPTWEEIAKLLADEPLLAYKIDIETDSTIKFDQDAERDARVEFLSAVGGFLKEAMQAPPELQPLAMQLLQFGVRGFKVGKELEGQFELLAKKLEKEADNPQPKPDPDMAKVQAQAQAQQQQITQEGQLKAQQQQADMALEQFKAQMEDKRIQVQAQFDDQQAKAQANYDAQKIQMEDGFNRWKTQMDNETKIAVAQIQAKAQLDNTALSKGSDDNPTSLDESGNVVKGPSTADLMNTVIQQLQQGFAQLGQSHMQLAQAITKPKTIIRDENGNMMGVQ